MRAVVRRAKAIGAVVAAAVLAMNARVAEALPIVGAGEYVVGEALDSLADLPLVVVRASGAPSGALAVLLTGDGGWAGLDKQLADSVASHGTPVVALDSRTYFSRKRDPESGR